jgi:hypothetical protein
MLLSQKFDYRSLDFKLIHEDLGSLWFYFLNLLFNFNFFQSWNDLIYLLLFQDESDQLNESETKRMRKKEKLDFFLIFLIELIIFYEKVEDFDLKWKLLQSPFGNR